MLIPEEQDEGSKRQRVNRPHGRVRRCVQRRIPSLYLDILASGYPNQACARAHAVARE